MKGSVGIVSHCSDLYFAILSCYAGDGRHFERSGIFDLEILKERDDELLKRGSRGIADGALFDCLK